MKRTYYARACLAASLLALSLISTANARIITVDDDAPADFNNIQAAIDDANDADTVEIQPGTYTGLGNYDIRFNGKSITVRGTNPEDFDIVAATVIDCNQQGYGFRFASGEDASSVLSGLKITNGSGGWRTADGGAIACHGGSPTITNCILTGNRGDGGAIGANDNTDLIVRNCIITHNTSELYGGGIFSTDARSATIENCIISHNTSERWGGGIRIRCDEPSIVRNCIITGNRSEVGGGISARAGNFVVTGCVITGNIATERGGGISARQYCQLAVSNSIVCDNYAPEGPEIALYNGWGSSDYVLSASYSNIAGGWADLWNDGTFTTDWGPGNIDADPLFADPGYWGHAADPNIRVEPNDPNAAWVDAGGDYRLKSQAGRWNANEGGWTIDEVTSLCIDAGDPMYPLGLEPFPNGGRINIGVYGATAEASKSYFDKPPCETIVAGDVNGDCIIDGRDFALLAGNWLISSHPSPGRATNPDPPDGATDASSSVLTWTSGDGATSHDVYFGTTSPGTFQGNQTDTTFDPHQLSDYTTYYWRIDELNTAGTTTGTVWTFTTGEGGKVRCFPADTIVWADGEMVEISKVVAGAMVDKPAVAPTITDLHKTVCAHQIEGIDVHNESDSWDRYDIVFENGNTLAVADSHYFLLDSGKWTSVQKLTTGSKLSTLDGLVTVKTIKKTTSTGTVYNLKIKDAERYLVGKDGVIVRDW